MGCVGEEPPTAIDSLDRATAGLDGAKKSQVTELSDGAVFQLEAKPVVKNVAGNAIRMYAYNGQIPGPLMRVRQGSSVYINFTNGLDMKTTVHWHGIRLENRYDGVPNLTQRPVKPGESFLYKLDLPDDGVYWYHPHVREDAQQELGLYGNILVEPAEGYNPEDEEVFLFLDDIKIVGGDVDPFSRDFARYALTGRFGNVLLVNGETDYQRRVKRGEVVRFYLTASSSVRVFNFSIEDHRMKLVGGDSGRYERESLVDSVVLSPAERYIVEVLFDMTGTFKLLHVTPRGTHGLGVVEVSEYAFEDQKSTEFYTLKENNGTIASIMPFKKYISTKPDYELVLTLDAPMMEGGMGGHGMMGGGPGGPIEWEEDADMAALNSASTSRDVRWMIKDGGTGEESPNYRVKVGDVKKVRIFNDPGSVHPMQHPIHLHGQRFLVLGQDGESNDNLVWKDTVLLPAGGTVDILVDFTNPGEWLIHCHIPEHLEAGMEASSSVGR